MNVKILKHDIGVSEATLKRTKATRLDLAVVSEQLQELKSETCRDLESSRSGLQTLDAKMTAVEAKMTAVDAAIDAIGGNIGQCQSVIVAVKETLDAQTGRLTMALREADEQHRGRYAVVDEKAKAVDERMTAMDERITTTDGRMNEMNGSLEGLGARMNEMHELIRSIDGKTERQFDAMQSRVQSLEDHLPKLEAEMKALEGKADRIEQFQQKINARIVTVMRMSLAIIGVIAVTAIVFGIILLKR